MPNEKSPSEGEMRDDLSRRIHEQIQKKAESDKFELNIKDEDFLSIPDINFEKNRRTATVLSTRETTGKDFKRIAETDPVDQRKKKRAHLSKKTKATGRVFGSMIYLIAVIGVSVVLSLFILTSLQDYMGLYKSGEYTNVVIPEDADLNTVAKILKENKIINQTITFKFFANRGEAYEGFKSGEFRLDPKMSYHEIFSVLSRTDNVGEVVDVVIPEGRTIREIGAILEEAGVCTAEEFVEAAKAMEPKYEWQKAIVAANDGRYFNYEGYFFPNTWQMWVGEKPHSVVWRFVDDFNNQLSTRDLAKMEELGLSMDELITLASLIEREASGHSTEMFNISAIFHNRLKEGSPFPKLQSDVTRNYVESDIKPYVGQVAEQERYASIYNTYKATGLPVGPVCNPGKEAIEAALYPEPTYLGNFYFFVTDVNDKFYYAKTLDEHYANVAVAEAVVNDEGESQTGGLSTQDDEEDE